MLILAFFLALLAFFLQASILPQLNLLPFLPFLALTLLRCELPQALWLSCFSGAIIDLFSDDPMGLHALNYTLLMGFVFKMKKLFSYEYSFHLSFLTALLSFLSTLLQLLLLFLFDRRVPFDGRWILADLFGMPWIDALYAFVWFTAPLSLANTLKRFWVIFWLNKKSLFRILR